MVLEFDPCGGTLLEEEKPANFYNLLEHWKLEGP